MATSHYTKRAQDKLDISLVVDFYLNKITSACKGAVAHAVSVKIERLVTAKKALESKLRCLTESASGFFKKLKTMSKSRKIKREIASINNKMVEWLNVVYVYFLSK